MKNLSDKFVQEFKNENHKFIKEKLSKGLKNGTYKVIIKYYFLLACKGLMYVPWGNRFTP